MSNAIDLIDSVLERIARDGLSALTAPERHYVALCELEAEVNNGSFVQYFANSAGDLCLDALEALQTVGATEMAAVFRQALALFPVHVLPDHDLRATHLNGLSQTDLSKLEFLSDQFVDDPDDIAERMDAYVQAHDAAFLGPRNALALWQSKRSRGVDTTPRTVRDPIDFDKEAEIDRPYSSRPCPMCAYPSPDYRASCKRCGYPHGRADGSAS